MPQFRRGLRVLALPLLLFQRLCRFGAAVGLGGRASLLILGISCTFWPLSPGARHVVALDLHAQNRGGSAKTRGIGLALASLYPARTLQAAGANQGSVLPPPVSALAVYQPWTVSGMARLGGPRQKDKGYFLLPAKWDTKNIDPSSGTFVYSIPVCWKRGSPEGPERLWVEDSVRKSWEAHSGGHLRFIGFRDCALDAVGVRIAVRDDGEKDGPHTTDLGKFLSPQPGEMVLNFTFQTWSQACAASPAQRESCIRSIAVHEFGHALGFAHEQNRADTPGECTEKPQGRNGNIMLTPWDQHSVMNYCNPVYNNNGVLSDGDIASLNSSMAYGS